MALTYSLAPSPKWYFADATGRPAAGGTMTTRSAIDHSTPMMIFSDPLGLHPYANPMVLDASGGTRCPMYWDVTTAGLYYVEVKDAAGNIICTVDRYPLIGGGGVTPITDTTDIENHLVNGQFLFIDAIDEAASVVSPIPDGETRMAPGSGFFKNLLGEYVPSITAGQSSGWSFFKAGGVGATDSVEFVAVTALGAGVPSAPTANATRYFRFVTSAIGTGYTEAVFRNIIPNVELFQNELLTFSFDTRGTSAAIGALRVIQHFGTGGSPSADVITPVAFTFSSGAWARQTKQITVPSIVGMTKGTNQDDCLIIEWRMQLNVLGTFELANLQAQRGNFGLEPYIEQTYAQDQYKVLMDLMTYGNLLFRTGDYRWSDNGADLPGWLLLDNDAEYIGKTVASTANHYGPQYQNLYVLWWTIYPQTGTANQMICDVNGGRGGSAIADFNADKRMRIPFPLVNRVFGVAGNAFGPDYIEGERTHTLTIAEMPSHQHSISFADSGIGTAGGGGPPGIQGTTVTGFEGGGGAHNNIQPTTYKYLFVKL